MNQSQEQKFQFIRFDRGISQFNHDYYAALGLPIISNPMYIRNVYLRIARILHPDIYGFSLEEKEIATRYLAKLVNPAYNSLMKEQERKAYQGIYKLLAKRLMQRSRNIQIHSAVACELMITPSDHVYERLVTEIAKVQYQSLTDIWEHTAQISELNLVYILYQEGYRHGAVNMPPVLVPMLSPQTTKSQTPNYLPPPSKPSYAYHLQYSPDRPATNLQTNSEDTVIQVRESGNNMQMIDNRLKICEIQIMRNDWQSALRDLRDVLQIAPNNSKCLAMLGVVYTNIDQPQMAKASFKRSLQINPQEALALTYLLDSKLDSNSNLSQAHKTDKKDHLDHSLAKLNRDIPPKKTNIVQNSLINKLFQWISRNH